MTGPGTLRGEPDVKISDQDKFEPGEVIFSKGDASECAFLIQSGSVEIVIENGDRRLS